MQPPMLIVKRSMTSECNFKTEATLFSPKISNQGFFQISLLDIYRWNYIKDEVGILLTSLIEAKLKNPH